MVDGKIELSVGVEGFMYIYIILNIVFLKVLLDQN